MSFFNKLFGSNTKNTSQQTASENANFAPQLETFINTLLSKDSYIARSDYTPFLRQNSTEIDYLKKLYTDRLLENYCKQNKLNFSKVQKSINDISAIKDLVSIHNQDFLSRKMISEKEYLDNILKVKIISIKILKTIIDNYKIKYLIFNQMVNLNMFK